MSELEVYMQSLDQSSNSRRPVAGVGNVYAILCALEVCTRHTLGIRACLLMHTRMPYACVRHARDIRYAYVLFLRKRACLTHT